ncbi:MAG: hypothetical protein C4297_12305 [Gemmataceae bacterium]
MNTTYLQVTAYDNIIARDGRPFGIGQRIRPLDWLMPSVVAGSFRTAWVKSTPSLEFTGSVCARLLRLAVSGAFPVANGQLYLPAPLDCLVEDSAAADMPAEGRRRRQTIHRLVPRPLPAGAGCDFPIQGLQPVMLPESGTEVFKPAERPAWWPLDRYREWLVTDRESFAGDWFDASFLRKPEQEYRDHVSLDAHRGAARQGRLFATTGLHVRHLPRFRELAEATDPYRRNYQEISLTVRVTVPDEEPELARGHVATWHPLGGERRLVHWQTENHAALWQCPDAVRQALNTAQRVRLILATPGIFKHGWRPGWLDDHLCGSPPGCGVQLRLVGVCSERWKAVSGWSLAPMDAQGKPSFSGPYKPGPKPIRRMVPAGSVYFFECLGGNPADLAQLWLQPVCDDESECNDGFGLAIWGVW